MLLWRQQPSSSRSARLRDVVLLLNKNTADLGNFITNDPNFGYWADAMTFQFPGRLHCAFDSEAAADVFLSTPREAR